MTYTVADLDYAIGELEDTSWTSIKYEDFPRDPDNPDERWPGYVNLEGIGKLELEAEYGGEGKGEEYWVVVKVTDSEGNVRYFRKDGWYMSYSGGELDGDTREVFPREKTIIVYE